MIKSWKQIQQGVDEGNTHYAFYIKKPQPVAGAYLGAYDKSMSGSIPAKQYYASEPLISRLFPKSAAMNIGQDPSPKKRYLRKMEAANTNWAAAYHQARDGSGLSHSIAYLCDYLLYYPFIDLSEATTVELVNSVALNRYETGEGVRIALIAQSAGLNSLSQTRIQIKYTNQNGDISLTPIFKLHSGDCVGGVIGAMDDRLTSYYTSTIFVPLAVGDNGVRSIQEIEIITNPQGVIFTALLVKPLTQWSQEVNVNLPATEKNFATSLRMPEIHPEACLNIIEYSYIGSTSTNAPNIMNVFEFTVE